MTDLGFERTLHDTSVDDAVGRVTRALAAEGFGVLTEIDVQATLKKKLNLDFRPYRILGACNPNLAHAALSANPRIGLLLPCNVVVEQLGRDIRVSIANPRAMFNLVPTASLERVVTDAEARVRRALAAT